MRNTKVPYLSLINTTLIMGRMMKMMGEIFVVGKMGGGRGRHYAVKSVARSLEMVMSASLKNSEW